MIQFNLLPAVKLEYIKAKQVKRTVMVISTLVAITAVSAAVLLFLATIVFQRQHIANLDKDIKRDRSKLESTEDLDKILTVQNQLNSLPDLHNKKPVTSRLFGYMQKLTPAKTSIAQISINFADSTITMSGAADSLSTINKYVDTLKFTNFKETVEGEEAAEEKAFSEVVLTGFGRDDKGASYQINMKFNPTIFDNNTEVTLIVPNIITTRSAIEKPDALFQPLTNTQGGN